MKVSPSTDGLERASFSILQPIEGDDVSALKAINIHGESVGYSYSKAELDAIGTTDFPTLYYSDIGTITISEAGSRDKGFILDTGEVICPLHGNNFHGGNAQAVGQWSPETSLQILVDAADFGAASLDLINASEAGSFLFNVWETVETNTATVQVKTAYLYDGAIAFLNDDSSDPYTYFIDLNGFGDLISSYTVYGKGKEPDQRVNQVFFAGFGVTENLDNMMDDANDPTDVDRWFSNPGGVSLINDYGIIIGETGGDTKDTFILVPVSP